MFVAPDAWPASCGRTELSTALAAGAKTRAIPAPAIANGPTSCAYGTSGVETSASSAIAPACNVRPSVISGREPMRSDRTPAIGATRIVTPVHGSVRSPACSGE